MTCVQAEPAVPDVVLDVNLAKGLLSKFPKRDQFIADKTKGQVKVLISTSAPANQFKFLKIDLKEVDANGKATFTAKALYEKETLMPNHPLVVGMTFFDSLPHYGVSYVDESGTVRNFAIDMSADDGTVMLSIITIVP